MNTKNWKSYIIKQNSEPKSLQKKPQSMRQFEQPSVRKLREKSPKLMPFKK